MMWFLYLAGVITGLAFGALFVVLLLIWMLKNGYV